RYQNQRHSARWRYLSQRICIEQKKDIGMNPQLLERARLIRLLILDVDGVLTDGKLYFGNAGEELKTFCTLDGHGIKLLQKSGVRVGIITGRRSELVA